MDHNLNLEYKRLLYDHNMPHNIIHSLLNKYEQHIITDIKILIHNYEVNEGQRYTWCNFHSIHILYAYEKLLFQRVYDKYVMHNNYEYNSLDDLNKYMNEYSINQYNIDYNIYKVILVKLNVVKNFIEHNYINSPKYKVPVIIDNEPIQNKIKKPNIFIRICRRLQQCFCNKYD